MSSYCSLVSAGIKFLPSLNYKTLVKMKTFTSFQKQENCNNDIYSYHPLKFKCETRTLHHYEQN